MLEAQMSANPEKDPTGKPLSQEERRAPNSPARSSDDYVEQSGRAGREMAQRLILETREELAKLKST